MSAGASPAPAARGIDFNEVRGDDDPAFDQLLLERTGGLTVPQVVIDDVPIGGADSLERLDRLGVLPKLLGDDRFPLARIVRRLSLRGIVEMYVSGGGSGPWRYRVELVDALGQVVERHRAASAEEVDLLATTLRRRDPRKAARHHHERPPAGRLRWPPAGRHRDRSRPLQADLHDPWRSPAVDADPGPLRRPESPAVQEGHRDIDPGRS